MASAPNAAPEKTDDADHPATAFEIVRDLPQQPIDGNVPDSIMEAAIRMMQRSRNKKTTPDQYTFLGQDHHAFLLRHESGENLAFVMDPDGDNHNYIYEQFFPSLGVYFHEGKLLKPNIEREIEGTYIFEVKGLGRRVYYYDPRYHHYMSLYNAFLPEAEIGVDKGEIYELIVVDKEMLENDDGKITTRLKNKKPGSVRLIMQDEKGRYWPVRNQAFPFLNLATDNKGRAYMVRSYQVAKTDYFLMFIPNHTQLGDFKYDGSGNPSNICVFKLEGDTTRPATEEELESLVGLNSEELLHAYERFDPRSEHREFNYPLVTQTGRLTKTRMKVPDGPRMVEVFHQRLEIFTKPYTTNIELVIEAADRGEYEKKLEYIKDLLERTPIPLFRQIRRIEIYKDTPSSYGYHSYDVGGVYYGMKRMIRLFSLTDSKDLALMLLHHELWHSLHGPTGTSLWQRIILAMKAGDITHEEDYVARTTNSDYHLRSWEEYVAEVGSLLFPYRSEETLREPFELPALSIPNIASALMMIIDAYELAPTEETIAI